MERSPTMLAQASASQGSCVTETLKRLPVEQVLSKLTLQPGRRQSSSEAQQRLAQYGPNALVERPRRQDPWVFHRSDCLQDRPLVRLHHQHRCALLQHRARILEDRQASSTLAVLKKYWRPKRWRRVTA